MKNIFEKVITDPLKDFFQRFVEFLPSMLSSVFILIIGFLSAWILKTAVYKFLKVLNVDHFSQRMGITQAIEKGGIKETPTGLISRIFYWLTVIVFTIMALYTLKIPTVENLLERFFLYLPNVFVAAILIIIGYTLSNFLSRAALIASVNAGIRFSGLLSKGVKISIILLVLTMALEQLGIGRDTVIIAFSIVFGGVVFATALAFGLAGKDIAREYLEKRFKGEPGEKDEIQHL